MGPTGSGVEPSFNLVVRFLTITDQTKNPSSAIRVRKSKTRAAIVYSIMMVFWVD